MKKTLSLFLSLLMVLGLAGYTAAEEPFVITVMLPDFYVDVDFVKDDNPVLKAIEEKSGVRLDITWVANSAYGEQTSVTLADPANMPMIMVMQGPRDPMTVNSARAGAFWDLTDYIPQTEYLSQGSEKIYNNIAVDGRIYGIYRSRATARNGIYYRSDIAAELGFTEKPKTVEELTAMSMAMAAMSEDTYALNMCKYVDGTIKIATVMHGAPNIWGISENGDVYPAHTDPHFLEGLNWLRELYAAGGIDPDFMVIESGTWNDAERNDKAFMRFDTMDNGYRQQEWFEQNKGATELIFALLPNVTNAQGEIRMVPTVGYNGEVVITKAVKSEEDMLKCLKFLDWLNSAEGQTLINWGLEGLTYGIDENGFRTILDEQTQFVQAVQHSLNQLGMNVNGDLTPAPVLTPLRSEYNEIQLTMVEHCIFDPCHSLESETAVMFGSVLTTMLEDAHVQYIAGQIDEDGLRAAWQQWADDGGTAMTEEYNQAYKAAFGK